MQQAHASDVDSGQAPWKRVAATVAGGTLLAMGLKRRTIPGYAAALAGGWLVYRGIKGDGARRVELTSMQTEPGASVDAFEVQRTVTIEAPPEQVAEFLREPENVARVMGQSGDVQQLGEDRQRWILHTPFERDLVWEMRFSEEATETNEYASVSWESTPGAIVPSELMATVRSAPGEHGTELAVEARFDPPGGALGTALLDRLDLVPYALVGRTMRRVKSIVETGEAPTLASNPSARSASSQTSPPAGE